MQNVINNPFLSKESGKIGRALLILISLSFIANLLTPSNRLEWFINLGFYTILLVIALIIFQILLSRFSKSPIQTRELVFEIFNFDNIFLAVSALLLTINTITLQPAFESAQCSPILSRYYIAAYFLFVAFLIISTKCNLDPIIKGIVPLLLFSFITYSVPFEIHLLGFLPHIGFIIFLFLKLSRREEFYNFGFFKMPFDGPIFLLLASGLISTIFAFYPHESTKAFIRYSIYFMTYFVISRTFHRKDVMRTLLVLFLLFSVFLSILFIYKISFNALQFNFYVSLMFKMWISQIHPNAIVLYAIMVLSFTVGCLLFISNRVLKLTLCLIIPCLLFLIILTYSKTGYLSLIFSLLVIFILNKRISGESIKNYIKTGMYKYIILLILSVLIITVFPKIMMRIQNRFLNTDYLKERLLYWELGARIIKDHPIDGAGFRSYYLLSKYLGQKRYDDARLLRKLFLGETLGSHLHNSFIELAETCGIMGFFALIWLSLTLLKLFLFYRFDYFNEKLKTCIHIGAMTSAFALLIGALFDHLMEFFGIGILFYTNLGILSSCYFKSDSSNYLKNLPLFGKKLLKFSILLVVIFYVFVILSKSGTAVLLEMGKKALLISAEKAETYFRILNVLAPYDWESNEVLIQKLLDKAGKQQSRLDVDKCFNIQKLIVEKNPHFASGYRNLGYLYWLYGDLNQTKKCFEIAVDLDPAGGFWDEHYSNLALVEYTLGDYENAFLNMKEAVKLNPLTVNADFWLKKNIHDSPSRKIISPRFTLRNPNLYDKLIFRQYLENKLITYQKGNTRPLQAITAEKAIEDNKDDGRTKEIGLNDILKSIYKDYIVMKNNHERDTKTVLISLVFAYYHLDDKNMVDKLMKEEGLDYIPAFNTRGMIIPGLDPFSIEK